MGNEFASDLEFQKAMRPAAYAIYEQLFPGCRVEELKIGENEKVNILDQNFAIDLLIRSPNGGWVTMQEKYRRAANWEWRDFTQEYLNGAGTAYERKGEWFNLASQLYFYGWADEEWGSFDHWLLLDVVLYRMQVEEWGGLDKIGKPQKNAAHGKANFYGIPIVRLDKAILKCKGIQEIDPKSPYLQDDISPFYSR
jgi:hypothetical protein